MERSGPSEAGSERCHPCSYARLDDGTDADEARERSGSRAVASWVIEAAEPALVAESAFSHQGVYRRCWAPVAQCGYSKVLER